MTDHTKPLVQAALICDQVIEGKDGVLSAIRIVDTMQIPQVANLPSDVQSGAKVTFLLMLRSPEPLTGHVTLVARSPEGGPIVRLPKMSVVMPGGVVGTNFVATLVLAIGRPGLHWFDVEWNDQDLLTSIPVMQSIAPASDEPAEPTPTES